MYSWLIGIVDIRNSTHNSARERTFSRTIPAASIYYRACCICWVLTICCAHPDMSVAAARSSFIRPRRVFTLVAVVVGAAAVSLGIYTEMSVRAIKAKNAAANLAGKHAVVIGGTSGIGHGIAATLAAANASVTIVGRNAAAGQEIVTELSR